MQQIHIPKTLKELLENYKEATILISKLNPIVNQELQNIVDFVDRSEDPSGIINQCVIKYPNFVPHVQSIRSAVKTMQDCARCLNDNAWLASHRQELIDYNKTTTDEDSSSGGSGGGTRLVNLFNTFNSDLDLTNAINMNLNQVFENIYQLRHSKELYYDRAKVKDLSQNLDKIRQNQQQLQIELTKKMVKSKNMSKGSM